MKITGETTNQDIHQRRMMSDLHRLVALGVTWGIEDQAIPPERERERERESLVYDPGMERHKTDSLYYVEVIILCQLT